MQHKLLFGALILGALIISSVPVKADFLELGPGDYTVILTNSGTFCGGSDCSGTVHIGSASSTGFDWSFQDIGAAANDFNFSAVTHLGAAGFSECAAESLTSLSMLGCSNLSFMPPRLERFYVTTTQARSWNIFLAADSNANGSWTVPEPLSSTLVLFGLGALGLRRRLKTRQAWRTEVKSLVPLS